MASWLVFTGCPCVDSTNGRLSHLSIAELRLRTACDPPRRGRASRHVLAAVVAHALADRCGAGVAHGEALRGDAAEEGLGGLRGANGQSQRTVFVKPRGGTKDQKLRKKCRKIAE